MSTLDDASDDTTAVVEVTDHAEHRWRQRGDKHLDPLAVWRVAHPVHYPSGDDGNTARYHPETATLLLAKDIALVTVIPLWHRPQWEQEYVRDQVQERDLR